MVSVGGWEVTWMGVALGLGWVGLVFSVWRKMREDYDEEDILTLLIWLTVAAWVGSRLVWTRWSGLSLAGMMGLTFGLLGWWCWWKKWDGWEWLDTVGVASLGLGAVGAASYGPGTVWLAVILAVGWGVGKGLVWGYRRFAWYKSGKVGMAGVVSLGWWAGAQVENAYLLAWIVIACAVVVYLRGGRKASEDLAHIWQKVKIKKR